MNKKLAKIEYIKKTKNKRAVTFKSEGRAKIVVYINLCNPYNPFTSLNNLEILKILNILAICGPTLRKLIKEEPK